MGQQGRSSRDDQAGRDQSRGGRARCFRLGRGCRRIGDRSVQASAPGALAWKEFGLQVRLARGGICCQARCLAAGAGRASVCPGSGFWCVISGSWVFSRHGGEFVRQFEELLTAQGGFMFLDLARQVRDWAIITPRIRRPASTLARLKH
jgi:hypothetical protein